MAIPFPDRKFDVAVMALVIFFVPNPASGSGGDEARGSSRGNSNSVCLGYPWWRISLGVGPGSDARHGFNAGSSAKLGGLTLGTVTRAVD